MSLTQHARWRFMERHSLDEYAINEIEDLIDRNVNVVHIRVTKEHASLLAVYYEDDWFPVIYNSKDKKVITVYPRSALDKYEGLLRRHETSMVKRRIEIPHAPRYRPEPVMETVKPISATSVVARCGTQRDIAGMSSDDLELEISCLKELVHDPNLNDREKSKYREHIKVAEAALWLRETNELCRKVGISDIRNNQNLLGVAMSIVALVGSRTNWAGFTEDEKAKLEVIARAVTGQEYLRAKP